MPRAGRAVIRVRASKDFLFIRSQPSGFMGPELTGEIARGKGGQLRCAPVSKPGSNPGLITNSSVQELSSLGVVPSRDLQQQAAANQRPALSRSIRNRTAPAA